MTAPDLGTQHQFHGVQPVLPVADVTRAARYFRDVLGFEIDFIAGEPPSYARVKKAPNAATAIRSTCGCGSAALRPPAARRGGARS